MHTPMEQGVVRNRRIWSSGGFTGGAGPRACGLAFTFSPGIRGAGCDLGRHVDLGVMHPGAEAIEHIQHLVPRDFSAFAVLR